MEFLVPQWQGFFRICLEKLPLYTFHPLPKPTQSFSKGKALILRIIKSESKKLWRSVVCNVEMLELHLAAVVTMWYMSHHEIHSLTLNSFHSTPKSMTLVY